MHTRIKQQDAVTTLRLVLKIAGFSPIPAKGKAPVIEGWQKQFNVSDLDIAGWREKHRYAKNTGIITRDTPALDIDILNTEAVAAAVALVRQRFEGRGRILLRTGLAPKILIPFRTSEPFSKITILFDEGEKLEFLGDGQQFIAAGIHPDTRQPYTWGNDKPGKVTRQELPEIAQAEAQALIEDIEKLLADFGYTRARVKNDNSNPFDEFGKQSTRQGKTIDEIFDLLQSCRDGNWHVPMRDAIASMIGRGWSKEMVKLTCAPYAKNGIDNSNVEVLIDGAFEKFGQPDDGGNDQAKTTPSTPCSLDEVHNIFRKHFGKEFDLDALDIMLAVAASQQLDGDPVWLLMVAAPGAAKTEQVQTLAGAGAHVTSTITSEGALLSASPKRGKTAKTATGGLLRKIGSEGILVIKDVTSILSSSRDPRATVLAALREIYDGRWERNVGNEGGQTLTWTGRITVIGAVTTAWDAHHAVVAVMGDRFVLVRIDLTETAGRLEAGRRAMNNTGNEIEMRQELVDAVGGLLGNLQNDGEIDLTDGERTQLLTAANIVTLARTAVELDFKRDVIDAHAPEMPTRFSKQLVQVVRGGIAVGIPRDRAMRLAIRCARDSIPPLRIAILCDIALSPNSSVGEVRKRIGKPWVTTKREMDALTMLGLLACDETNIPSFDENAKDDLRRKWEYRLAEGIDEKTLLAMAGRADGVNAFQQAAARGG